MYTKANIAYTKIFLNTKSKFVYQAVNNKTNQGNTQVDSTYAVDITITQMMVGK